MLKTEIRTIGSNTYHVRQLGAKQGRQVLTRLIKTLGPVLGALLEGLDPKTVSVLDLKGEALARALTELAGRLGETDLDYLCGVFGETTQVEFPDGRVKPLTLEEQNLHFAGAYQDMFRWLSFALEVNFAGFFGALGTVASGPTGPEEGT